jgi:hypothetical protein
MFVVDFLPHLLVYVSLFALFILAFYVDHGDDDDDHEEEIDDVKQIILLCVREINQS